MAATEYGPDVNLEELRGQLAGRVALLLACVSGLVAVEILISWPFPLLLFCQMLVLVVLGWRVRVLVDTHPRLARHVLVWGLSGGLLAAMCLFPEPWLPFLSLMLISCGGLLVQGAQFVAAGAVAALATARANEKWAFHGHVFIWETMRQSMGDVTMYESLILDPGWIKDFNRVYTDFFKAQFALVFKEVGMPDGIWIYEDLGYKNGLFASPKVLKSLIFPYFAELVDFFHSEYDLPVVLHSCGNITDAIPMIIDAGFDALQPMEIKAGCDPFAFAEQYGDKLAFIGGLDVRFLETNDQEVIEREVTRLVEGMKERGARYLFHSDHSITPLVHYDSYRYALDVYRKHMMY